MMDWTTVREAESVVMALTNDLSILSSVAGRRVR